MNKSSQNPIFVDLDGTLIATDTLVESILLFLRNNPINIFLLIVWLFKGKAKFKSNVVKNVKPKAELLPYNSEVLDYLKKEKKKGKQVYLITASNQIVADSIANYIKIFDGAYGSSRNINLSGKRKLDVIDKITQGTSFDYIGNSADDIPVWEKADRKILVNTPSRIKKKIIPISKVLTLIPRVNVLSIKTTLKAIRVHQWAKNSLLFLPILMAHQFSNINSLISTVWAFLSFSFCASSVYVLNDLLDLETDRKHPTKRTRPFASGDLSIAVGIMLLFGLLLVGIAISVIKLSTTFLIVLLFYMIVTTLYSLILKQILMVDVIILGGLYTLRIAAGSVASMVEVSSWLLVFSMFFFLSLAFMKRYADLILIKKNKDESIAGRGYSLEDLDLVQKSGITSGFVAILVLALYVNSAHVMVLYKSPILIWLVLPVLLYWLMRMWAVTNRGEMDDDPIIYAVKDKMSYVSIIIIIVIMILAATIDKSIFNNLHIIQ